MRETLEYAAKLRNARISSQKVHEVVEKAIAAMNLSKVADRRVGSPTKRGVAMEVIQQ